MTRSVLAMLGILMTGPIAYAETEASLQAGDTGTYAATVRNVTVKMVMSDENNGMRAADISVLEDGIMVYQTREDALFSIIYGPHLRIVEMNSANDTPEIFKAVYTGGAHCCVDIEVLSKTANGWKAIEMGQYDGDPEGLYPRDLDGDGVAEIFTYDNRFLYEFASYAGSSAPRQIISADGGTYRDVSADGRFEWTIRASLDEMGELPAEGEVRNSWLASYAATLLLLGEDDPLDFAVGQHDASVDWGMVRCSVETDTGQCPEGKSINIGFKAALTDMLTQNGYLEARN